MTFEEFMPTIHIHWRKVWNFDKTDMRKSFKAGIEEGRRQEEAIRQTAQAMFEADDNYGTGFYNDEAWRREYGKLRELIMTGVKT